MTLETSPQPLVSIVIVTWNRCHEMLETIQSITSQNYPHYEIIVVDNGSKDDTVTTLQSQFSEIKLIELSENLGAASGRKPGIQAANGEIIFLLDSDASLCSDTLVEIVSRFAEDPPVDMLSCKVLHASTGQIDPSAWLFTQLDLEDQDSEFDSYAFSEGAVAVRKQVFERLGYFWDYLFYGREGEEYALRVWDAGFTIRYFPNATILHRVSPNKRILTDQQLYYDLRNSLAIYIKHYPWYLLISIAPLKIVTSTVKGVRYKRILPILKALWDTIKNLRLLLHIRQPIRQKTAKTYLHMQKQHGRFRWTLKTWMAYNRYKQLEDTSKR